MNNYADSNILLERIATALEKIALILEEQKNTPLSIVAEHMKNEIPSHEDDLEVSTNLKYEKKEVDVNILIKKLAENRIAVKTYPEREQENSELDNLSLFMGNRFSDIKVVYEKLKRSLNSSAGFHLDMKTFSQSSVSYSCQLCTMLYQIAYLSEYKYLKSPRYT